jgi:hypothetical protein
MEMRPKLVPQRLSTMALGAAVAALLLIGTARAQGPESALLARLTAEQQQAYRTWQEARAGYERAFEAYWSAIEDKKAARRAKRELNQPVLPADYVIKHPPKYAGPPLRADIAAIKAEMDPPRAADPDKAGVADFLAMARQHYNFAPERTTEKDFKRRYALEALRLGLTKDQVLRVYALETGGRGTFDMQAGIDPETRKGRPISSALGYAQLLGGNSVNELVLHGAGFAQRLDAMAADPRVTRLRAQQLTHKAQIVRAMVRAAKSVPNHWNDHVKFATTPRGLGIHALNMDADVGPWMQVLKLDGLRGHAAKAGRMTLTGAELELMNLAGPRTALEMMEPAGHGASTANFFSQQGFYRNTIVRERSSMELLAALEERMNANLSKPGCVEFAAIFDQIAPSHVAAVRPPAAAPAAISGPAVVAPPPQPAARSIPKPAVAAPVPPPAPAARPQRVAEPTETGRVSGFAVFEPR